MAISIYDYEAEEAVEPGNWADEYAAAMKSYQQIMAGNQITGVPPLRNQQDYTVDFRTFQSNHNTLPRLMVPI